MATNPYFKEYQGEIDLLNDLTIETIKTMGRDMIYLPREYFNRDPVFGEDVTSKFREGYPIEMYIQNIQSFGGAGYFINKFGINIQDKLTLQVSRKRFETEIASKVSTITTPREGDLIYFPFNKSIFEINFVEDKLPFFQFGTLTTYTLTCELFTYSFEDVETEYTEIDEIAESRSYSLYKLSIGSAPVTGTALFGKGESIYQVNGVTGASAYALPKTATATISDVVSGYVLVRGISGTFVPGAVPTQSIIGLTSGTEYYLTGVTESNIIQPIDPVSGIDEVENDYYATQARTTLNFSRDNPFSEECT
jgi:hypothetical protein